MAMTVARVGLVEAGERLGGIVRSLDDVRLVPTPVKYSQWTSNGRIETVREEKRTLLFQGRQKATVILSNVYGDPFAEVGWLTSVRISSRAAGGNSPWEMMVAIIPPKKRKEVWHRRDFPVSAALIAWGEHAFYLSGLPPLTSASGIRWQCATQRGSPLAMKVTARQRHRPVRTVRSLLSSGKVTSPMGQSGSSGNCLAPSGMTTPGSLREVQI